ncbi:MAG: tetratricopeptide repeat protein [Sideroxydans sp.]|nr:tetratricopeptide repeat protein [Sideroxydans sp.]
MDMFNKLKLGITFCALLMLSGLSQADDIQDANKLFKQGQNTQALEKVNSFLSNKPKDPQARFLKGLIVNEQGNPAEAIKIFTALTDDYPELPEPYNNLAVLYAGQGQYDKAKIALEMAIRTHPSYATAHENLGDIYAKMASQAYDRALQLDKNNTATQTKLALIRDLFGKKQSGKPVTTTTAATTTKPAVVATAPTTPATTSTPASADTNAEVLKATKAWAAAWSAQNSDKYLSYYAADFKTPNGEGRAAWEAMRKDRISKPKSIDVGISEAKVSAIDAQHASVSFKQSYRATHLTSSSHKVLVWVKNGNNWQITEEQSSN